MRESRRCRGSGRWCAAWPKHGARLLLLLLAVRADCHRVRGLRDPADALGLDPDASWALFVCVSLLLLLLAVRTVGLALPPIQPSHALGPTQRSISCCCCCWWAANFVRWWHPGLHERLSADLVVLAVLYVREFAPWSSLVRAESQRETRGLARPARMLQVICRWCDEVRGMVRGVGDSLRGGREI